MSRAWMPFYVGDYQRDTLHLKPIEHGAYLLLIMHYWNHGFLPDDPAQLRRITGLERREWHRHWPVIKNFFYLATFVRTDSSQDVQANAEQLPSKCWRHKRLDAEIEKAENLSLKRSLAGYKGGRASHGKANGERHVAQAIAKQAGHTSQSHKDSSINLTSESRRPATLAEVVRAKGWA